MTDPIITDLRRELDKAHEALTAAERHLASHAEANAALHCSERVMYSPLHAKVTAAITGIIHALIRTEDSNETSSGGRQDTDGLVGVLMDLDRCEHGRHEGDECGDCGGSSRGNPHMRPGSVVGYGLYGAPIVMPDREHKGDPEAWGGRRRSRR